MCSNCGIKFLWDRVNYVSYKHNAIMDSVQYEQKEIESFFLATLRADHHQKFIDGGYLALRNQLLAVVNTVSEEVGEDQKWILKALSKVTKIRRFVINCYCYAHYTFEFDKMMLEFEKINLSKKTLLENSGVEKNTGQSGNKIENREKKSKSANTTEKNKRIQEHRSITISLNLFNRNLELLEDNIQQVMMSLYRIEDHFIINEHVAPIEESHEAKLCFLTQERNKMEILLNLLMKQREGLLGIITESEIRAY